MAESKALVDRYFELTLSVSWKDFTWKIDKLYEGLRSEIADKKEREVLNKKAKEWMERYG